MANSIDKHGCKKCKMLWKQGIDWCCKFGKEAKKAIGECKLKNGFEQKEQK